ncbi:2-isopropylmalate synthase [Magnetofaba australis]|uniref:2-isopropylmalate synthase n=1 Tax=Magnetofaba australis IT-1 TaxID=1434232 RepID=A0A1Y2K5J9_9PROT|nr:2-isopropylmalate synthase [Magnetofaba australis]OSM02275.1 putative 2-isopropylmalate synthase [Magnetofaba australis IT-1]
MFENQQVASDSEADRVIMFDTTLRDGEQMPGVALSAEQKVEIARNLAAVGVDVIEAGFPAASPAEFAAVQAVSRSVEGATICALARCVESDVAAALAATQGAKRRRIHVFIGVSPIHRQAKLRMTPEQVMQRAVAAVTQARAHCDDVQFSAEDATRAETPFLQQICAAAIDAGATTINIPDTVGYTEPWEYQAMMETLIATVPHGSHVRFSTHCHNDMGLATANTLAGVRGGARQVEVAINGFGERAGNAALEEVGVAISARAERFGVTHGVQMAGIYTLSQRAYAAFGAPIPPNKAVVGGNAFAHESGIHQHGVMCDARTYEAFTPQSVGREAHQMALGKHSGRHAFHARMAALGINFPSADEWRWAFDHFKQMAERQGEVNDAGLIALARSLAPS